MSLLIVWEGGLVMLPKTDLPDAAVCGGLSLLLWAMVVLGRFDMTYFLGRLGYAFALGWYFGSIGRWLPAVDQVYIDAADEVGLLLAASFLVVTPMGLLLAAAVPPLAGLWRGRRG